MSLTGLTYSRWLEMLLARMDERMEEELRGWDRQQGATDKPSGEPASVVVMLMKRLDELEAANAARHDCMLDKLMDMDETGQERYIGLDSRLIAHESAQVLRHETLLMIARGLSGELGQVAQEITTHDDAQKHRHQQMMDAIHGLGGSLGCQG